MPAIRLTALLAGPAAAAAAHAAVLHVPDDHPTIQAAIDAASHGDEIRVAPGVYPENLELPTGPVTLRSEVGPLTTTIFAPDATIPVLDVPAGGDALVEGFTFRHPYDSVPAGAIRVASASAAITGCRFVECRSDAFGAGVACLDGAQAVIADCEFIDGTAVEGAGVALVDPGTHATITGCLFTGNKAQNGGGSGVIIAAGATGAIARCTFLNNSGAAVWATSGLAPPRALDVTDCVFAGNTGNDAAGVRVWYQEDVLITGCTFLDAAGGIEEVSALESTLTISNCAFLDHPQGGARIKGGAANVQNCLFRGVGGAALVNDASASTVANCIFENNEGGVANTNGATPLITHCTFEGNLGSGGAALYNDDSAPAFEHCDFIGNAATLGGAVRGVDSAAAYTHCTFIGNTAGTGGAVHLTDGAPTFHACTFEDNSTFDFGGAVYSEATAAPIFTACAFRGNTAGAAGGAFYSLGPFGPGVGAAQFCENLPGNIAGAFTDLGGNAYFVACPDSLCPTDLDDDGLTGSADLNLVITDFGCTTGCNADIDADDDVDALDLAYVLGAFGAACP